MSSQRYSLEFKDEAVRQIIERGYSVTEVSERLGVSSHSLYKWVKAVTPHSPGRPEPSGGRLGGLPGLLYQPEVPGSPLNGPTTSAVIQPP